MKHSDLYLHLREHITDETWQKVEDIMTYFGTYWEDLKSHRNHSVNTLKYIHIRYARFLIIHYLHKEYSVPFRLLASILFSGYNYRSYSYISRCVNTMFTRHMFIERFYKELK